MKSPLVVRLPGAAADIPALPADLIQPMVDESKVAYFQPTPPPFYFLHSSHLPAGTSAPPHRHPCLAFHGCLQGPLSLFFGQREIRLEVGEFYLIGAGVQHSWLNRGPHLAANISLLIDPRRPGAWPKMAGVASCLQDLTQLVREPQRFQSAKDPQLKAIFWALADHLMAERAPSLAVTSGLLLTLLGRLVDRLTTKQRPALERGDTAQTMRRLLLARVGESVRVEEIARAVHLSPTQAKRIFRETYHCGIVAYFNQLKIWQAKRLLASTSLTVDQISGKLGFSSPSYFSRAFLRATRRSPTAFRAQLSGR